MTVFWVDVSHHDWDRRGKALNWAQITAAGLGTVMCARASYGDPSTFAPATHHFGDYMADAKASGFTTRGGYHNLIHSETQGGINRQVDYLRSELDKHGTEWAMCDVEAYEELVDMQLVPTWDDVLRFHDRWYQLENRVMAWYVARWVWRDHLGSPNLTGLRGPLINADYAGGIGAPAAIYASGRGDSGQGFVAYGGRAPDGLQFTDAATVPGITPAGQLPAEAQTDVNAYRGSLPQLVALLTAGTTPPTGDSPMATDDALWLGGLLNQANWKLDAMTTVAASQTASLAAITAALAAIGSSSPEVAAILAQVHVQLDEQTAALAAIVVSTVADLGEGGAAQVRKNA